MTYTSRELNILIGKYMTESGFNHSAFAFANEAHVDLEEFENGKIASGALPIIVQKGMYYTEAMLNVQNENKAECELYDKLKSLSLLEAARCEDDTSEEEKALEKLKKQAMLLQYGPSTSMQEPKRRIIEIHREDHVKHTNTNGVKRERQLSPKLNENHAAATHPEPKKKKNKAAPAKKKKKK